jgi:arsenate reductase
MSAVTLYHNPKCSKSRKAKEILEERGIEFETVAYLDTPPDQSTLEALISGSEDLADAFVRSSDDAFEGAGLSVPPDVGGVAALLAEHPAFLQRPILVIAGDVVIGRPTERVGQALDEAGL